MTAAPPTTSRSVALLRGVTGNFAVLWCAFVLAHLILGLLNLYGYGYPLGDVTSVYKFWAEQALVADYWVGIDSQWVYPIVAILPMLASHVAYPFVEGTPAAIGSGLYASTWLTLVMILDVIAFGFLTGWGTRRDRIAAGWWWVAFLLLLGPIALGRIDSVAVAFAMVGALLIASRPRVAAVLLTVAAWIKVWPGAIVVAMVVATRERWRVLVTAIATSVAIVALALSYGSGWNVFSFVTQQTGRGLQAEAPITTFWMWQAWAGAPGARVYYDQDMLTWQVEGAGVAAASSLMTPLLVLVVAAIAMIGIIVVRRGAPATTVLPPLVLAILTAMIAFQKVGSPQFISWLAVPVILGLVMPAGSPRFRTPAMLVMLIAALTHVLYPYLYGYLIGLFAPMLVVLTVRNALLFVLLGWAIVAIVRSPQRANVGSPIEPATVSGSVWPFAKPSDRVDSNAMNIPA